MNLKLNQLIPFSLKDRNSLYKSAIWNKEVIFKVGDYIKIEAPSGSGKTTLTHLLYKVRTDYEGSISYGDSILCDYDANSLAILRQKHLSIVFQDLRLFQDLSALENIEIKRLLTPDFSSEELVLEMADKLGITGILHQKTYLCSYGEQQRIAIIRALMQPFNWLILDEPFSHLDQENIKLASGLIEAACKQKNAGLIIMGLNKDQYFNYTNELVL